MQNNFDLFFQRVLKDEGTSYEDVPGDNGGPTKCGITIADVARWYGLKLKFDKQGRAVRGAGDWDKALALTKAVDPRLAHDIYKKFYWDTVRADELPSGLDYCVVDFAVNSGVGKSVPTLGALVGVKGNKMTDAMIAAARAYPTGLADLIGDFQDERKAYLIKISTPPKYTKNVKFKKGWLAREARVRSQALMLAAAASPGPPPIAEGRPAPKAVETTSLPDPETATAADLRPLSRKMSILGWVKTFFGLGAVGTGGFTLTDIVEKAKGVSDVFHSLVSDAHLVGAVVVCVAVLALAALLEYLHVDDYRNGNWTPSGGA